MPLPLLDFDTLVRENLPPIGPTKLKDMGPERIEEVAISFFDYKRLTAVLQKLFVSERAFLEQVSATLMKLMQGDRLRDEEE